MFSTWLSEHFEMHLWYTGIYTITRDLTLEKQNSKNALWTPKLKNNPFLILMISANHVTVEEFDILISIAESLFSKYYI